MQFLRNPGPSGNILATVAIGEEFCLEWETNSLPTWLSYCERHDLGLVVFKENLYAEQDSLQKKANWHKLLIGHTLINSPHSSINNICYLDTDILISPLAPNIFDFHQSDKISVVSQVHNLPQPLHYTLRRLAFLRHTHLSSRYPLDSALFMSPADIFKYHGFEPFDDYFCSGVFVFNLRNHSLLLKQWFEKYSKDFHTLTNGGEEPCFNYEVQSLGTFNLLPYEFQALWTYESAWRYPFIFDTDICNDILIRKCIESSLYVNHFLHFAGSWNECQMWKIGKFFASQDTIGELNAYKDYLSTKVTGKPKGMIRPD